MLDVYAMQTALSKGTAFFVTAQISKHKNAATKTIADQISLRLSTRILKI